MVKNINSVISSCHLRKDDKHFNIIKDNSGEYFEDRAIEALRQALLSENYNDYEKDMKLAVRLIGMALLKRKGQYGTVQIKENTEVGTGKDYPGRSGQDAPVN